MSQTGSPDASAARNEVAHVLRRMRAMQKQSQSLNDLLDHLAKLRRNSPDALKYVNIDVMRPDNPDQPPRLAFRVNKERLQKPRALSFTGKPAGSAAPYAGTGAIPS